MSPQTMQTEVIEGVVDGLTGNILRGWAWILGVMETHPRIEVHAEGVLLGSGDASTFRADLVKAGKRDGHCAFAIPLAPLPTPGSVLTVTAIGMDCVHPLVGSPFTIPAAEPAAAPPAGTDILPLPIGVARLQGSLDQCGPDRIRGWVLWLDGANVSPTLSLCEGDREWLRFEANQWRPDIADLHQGDGCCGFDVVLPGELRDGNVRAMELRLADSGTSLLAAPFHARMASAHMQRAPNTSGSPAALRREVASGAITLSVIVNFYNMQREAARTLASLSRDYQQDSGDLDYEVLCIDNGSSPPLDPAWIASFGPQFRLIRPSRQLASPCAALNEAALAARGTYLAVMIDGAHVLSPGVFREARQAWREHPDAVVAVRHWFIGGDQRWLTMVGYTREQEDRLFERIRWPLNGYDLFRIGAPMIESPEPWFDGLSESNCLMLPAALYDSVGGFDEAFDQAGGGFANLDLWRRVSKASEAPLVAPIGEASFHQFHGGTTTNVDDVEKDMRVRSYASAYRALRGEDFAMVERARLSFRGRLRSEFATGMRQRTLMPMRLDVTEQVRPGKLAAHFDDGAQAHLLSVYAECGLQNDVRWLGQPTGVAPTDLVSMQAIIHQIRPDAIVAAGVEAGLTGFIDSVVQTVGIPGARILHVGEAEPPGAPAARITTLRGSPADAAIVAAARDWLGGAEVVLVLHAAGGEQSFSLASLQAWGKLVSYRSFLICVGTVFGQPWLGYSSRQHFKTVRDFTESDAQFINDRRWTSQLFTTCPYGYLRKIGGSITATTYDAALDEIAAEQPATLEHKQ
jgi:cephalosporin hydroxylase